MIQFWSDIIRDIQEFARIPVELRGIKKNIEQHTETIRTAQKRSAEQNKMWEEWRDKTFSVYEKYENSEQHRLASDNRNYSVLNSTRWATWGAVLAASVYAAITFCQWKQTRENFVSNQRAWIGVFNGVIVDSVSLDSTGRGGKISYEIPMKNYGNSVASDIGITSQPINGFDNMSTISDQMCGEARTLSNLRHLKHIKNADVPYDMPQDISPGLLFQGEARKQPFSEVAIKTSRSPLGVYIVGCIVYKDEFGYERRTRFSYGGIGTGAIAAGSVLGPSLFAINDVN